jgi:CRISPR-associated endonuclease/helicase Cas3
VVITIPSYFQYWGKARPGDDSLGAYHLLPYHCLDVAAVGVSYLRQSPVLLETFCTVEAR